MNQTPPRAYRIDLPRPHPSYAAAVGKGGWPEALAHAVASSPAWSEMAEAKLMVFGGAEPHMVVLGRFDEVGRARLDALQTLVERHLPALEYLGWSAVERAVEQLAEKLTASIGPDVSGYDFLGVPRGGLIVLGMLAYALGLDQKQIVQGAPGDRPLVVVDDVAVSGNRVRRWLNEHRPSAPIVLATIYSSPALREAAELDSRVTAAVSARDLVDRAREIQGADYEAWLDRWSSRQQDGGAWFRGQPQLVCFPWNEPDIGVWNPVLGRTERAWRLMPPELCMKHRGSVSAGPEVVVVESSDATVRP